MRLQAKLAQRKANAAAAAPSTGGAQLAAELAEREAAAERAMVELIAQEDRERAERERAAAAKASAATKKKQKQMAAASAAAEAKAQAEAAEAKAQAEAAEAKAQTEAAEAKAQAEAAEAKAQAEAAAEAAAAAAKALAAAVAEAAAAQEAAAQEQLRAEQLTQVNTSRGFGKGGKGPASAVSGSGATTGSTKAEKKAAAGATKATAADKGDSTGPMAQPACVGQHRAAVGEMASRATPAGVVDTGRSGAAASSSQEAAMTQRWKAAIAAAAEAQRSLSAQVVALPRPPPQAMGQWPSPQSQQQQPLMQQAQHVFLTRDPAGLGGPCAVGASSGPRPFQPVLPHETASLQQQHLFMDARHPVAVPPMQQQSLPTACIAVPEAVPPLFAPRHPGAPSLMGTMPQVSANAAARPTLAFTGSLFLAASPLDWALRPLPAPTAAFELSPSSAGIHTGLNPGAVVSWCLDE